MVLARLHPAVALPLPQQGARPHTRVHYARPLPSLGSVGWLVSLWGRRLEHSAWVTAHSPVPSSAPPPQTQTYQVDEEFRIVSPILLGVFTLVELGRIRLGFVGNLRERVRLGACPAAASALALRRLTTCCSQIPELSAFLLLTCFPTLGLIVFLTFIQMPMLPYEPIIGFPLLLMLVSRGRLGSACLTAAYATGCSRCAGARDRVFIPWRAIIDQEANSRFLQAVPG